MEMRNKLFLIKYSSRDACHISSHSRSSSNGGFALCPICVSGFELQPWLVKLESRKGGEYLTKHFNEMQLSAFFRLISGIDSWWVFNDVRVDLVSQTNDLNLIEWARMERACFDARYPCVHIKNLFCFPHSSYQTLLWAFPPAAVNSNVHFWDSPQSKAHLLSGAWKQHGKFISNLQFTVSNVFAVPIRKGSKYTSTDLRVNRMIDFFIKVRVETRRNTWRWWIKLKQVFHPVLNSFPLHQLMSECINDKLNEFSILLCGPESRLRTKGLVGWSRGLRAEWSLESVRSKRLPFLC